MARWASGSPPAWSSGTPGSTGTIYYIQGVPEYSHHSVVQVPASRGADRPHGGGDLGLPRDRDQGADGPAAVDRLYFNEEEIDCIS